MNHSQQALRRALLLSSLSVAIPGIAQTTTVAKPAPQATKTPAKASKPAQPLPAWPTRPVRLIVPWPGGTSADILGRTIAEPLAKKWGQPVVIDNKPGAGANIGTDLLAKSTDGHTLGLISTGPLTTAKALNPKLPFDPIKDLRPISLVAGAPWVLVVSNSVPTTSPDAMWAYLRNLGSKGNFGSVGVGSAGHLSMELLATKTGITATHIPYPGNPQIVTAMIAGDIQLAMLAPAVALPQAKAGKIKAVGVSSLNRSSLMTELPSMAELGIRNYQFEAWNAMMAPVGMSDALAAKISQDVNDVVRDPEIRNKLFNQGWQIVGTSPEGLNNRIKNDVAMMQGVILMRNIKLE